MFERLQEAADRQADRLLMRVIHRLAKAETPEGVDIEPLDDGVRLSGRGLKHRMIDDAQLRNFGR
ncbi:hypothetical protein [uncultured Sphingorhabdus sp.]|uniref:hypothetical protein n=1 Tax=uncultured Sphingorhabdus sp. TaxID=1686106 RepID=UPI002636A9E7|nr:hypothetical protein [uncultured Sphingorhabdus sp.]HMS21594.1 hypothetical protein [Sphingorhabdus sp.]